MRRFLIAITKPVIVFALSAAWPIGLQAQNSQICSESDANCRESAALVFQSALRQQQDTKSITVNVGGGNNEVLILSSATLFHEAQNRKAFGEWIHQDNDFVASVCSMGFAKIRVTEESATEEGDLYDVHCSGVHATISESSPPNLAAPENSQMATAEGGNQEECSSGHASATCRRWFAKSVDDRPREKNENFTVSAGGDEDSDMIFESSDFAEKEKRDAEWRSWPSEATRYLCMFGFKRVIFTTTATSQSDVHDVDCPQKAAPGSEPIAAQPVANAVAGMAAGAKSSVSFQPVDKKRSALATPPKSEDAQSTGLEIEYDKFHNLTSVSTGDMTLIGERTHPLPMNLTISVSYACDGKISKCHPKTMEVLLVAETPSPMYAEPAEHLLVFLVDGKRIVAPEADWDSLIGSKKLPVIPNDLGVPAPEIPILHEFLNISMPTSDILKLAQADTVEGELGITPFQFGQENMLALRSLVSGLSPMPTRKR